MSFEKCFNALNGLLSFLPKATDCQDEAFKNCFNALNGLLSFLQGFSVIMPSDPYCFNALNGLLSFLRYPLRTRINTGFAGSFLQVFV